MENSFLHLVAKDLLSRYGDAISDFHFIFPNSRTRIFFLDELSQLLSRPIWQPHSCSVDDLFRQISGVERAERQLAVVELYKCYSKYHKEDFASFYFWGEMLLSDFDAIDKQLIDADTLFTNISDLKRIDAQLSYLTPEQIAIIKRFWSSFMSSDNFSEHQKKFLNIWETLSPIYHSFGKSLLDKGVAYTGQMQRIAVDKMRREDVPDVDGKHFVVVGFNALAETEKELFTYLKRNYEVDFYWDYDPYFLDDKRQEAGLFIRENLRRFPAPVGFEPGDNFRREKRFTAISAATNSLQCKCVGSILKQLAERGVPLDKRTAIVLADENLLVPLLYALPEEVKESNITMGYPLRQSLAYSFTERLLNLQKRIRNRDGAISFYHSDVTGLLTHPFLLTVQGDDANELYDRIIKEGKIYVAQSLLSEKGGVIGELFVPTANRFELTEYLCHILSQIDASIVVDFEDEGERRQALLQREYFVRIIESLNRLSRTLEGCGVEIDTATYSTLIRRVLQSLSIPFKGEPLEGLQIMGVLETRNLDFDNVIILSMNDDVFPGSRSSSSSFIPHNLRFAYGLPTRQYQEGVYAYYFYRLVSRAKRVEMIYCSSSDDGSMGEKSRFIYQLDYESPHKVEYAELSVDVTAKQQTSIEVEKSEAVMAKLQRYLSGGDRSISPSSFNKYLECPLKFYYNYVANIKPPKEISEEVDFSTFGTIFHDAMDYLYQELIDKDNPWEMIQRIESSKIDEAIMHSISQNMLGGDKDVTMSDLTGELVMTYELVRNYIKSTLQYDAACRGYKIVMLERVVGCDFGFECCDNRLSVRLEGKMDRMDMLDNGVLKIIDYKTGSMHKDFMGLADLFADLPRKRSAAVVQTMFYSLIISRLQQSGELQGSDICPSLYYIKKMNTPEKYSDLLNDSSAGSKVESYSDYQEELEELVATKLASLFDPAVPFRQCDEKSGSCANCDYKELCGR